MNKLEIIAKLAISLAEETASKMEHNVNHTAKICGAFIGLRYSHPVFKELDKEDWSELMGAVKKIRPELKNKDLG